MDLIGTDITKVAGMYSSFAGVLAGFVFVVIGILLGRRLPKTEIDKYAHNASLSWSVVAFVGLSMSCFLFALVAGEDRFVSATTKTHPELTRIRPLVLGIIASGVFTLAVLVLFLVLIWLFKRQAIDDKIIWQLRAVFWLVGLMAVFYFDGTFTEIPIALGTSGNQEVFSLVTTAVIGVLALVGGEVAGGILRTLTPDKASGGRHGVQIATQCLFFVAIFGCAFGFNIVDFADEMASSTWQVNNYEWWSVGTFAVAVFLCVLNLPEWRSPERPDSTNESDAMPVPAMSNSVPDSRWLVHDSP